MAYTLFLSHNSTDGPIVDEIRRRFSAAGIEVYTYEGDVQASSSLAEKLVEAIRSSDGVIALLTQVGASRPSIQQEIGAAIAMGKPVFPLIEEGVETTALALLQGLEYIRLDLQQLGTSMLALERSVRVRREKVRDALIVALIIFACVAAAMWLASKEG